MSTDNTLSLPPAFPPEEVTGTVVPQDQEGNRLPRITLVCSVYHSVPGHQPTSPEPIRYAQWLSEGDELAYSRTIKVSMEWKPLDLGWIKDIGASMIVLKNITRRIPGKRPSDEVIQKYKNKIIDYGMIVDISDTEKKVIPIGYLYPEQGIPLSFFDISNLVVRARDVDTKLTYFVIPA